MSRRRNVKRRLPSIEIVSFEGSSNITKRRVTLSTPDVIQPVEASDFVSEHSAEVHPIQPLIMAINDGNEGDDEDDSEDDQPAEVSNYKRKQQSSAKGWENIRDSMLQAVIESELISDGCLCAECHTGTAVFRCRKCGTGIFYCETCVSSVHSKKNVFHEVEEWKDGMFQPSVIIGNLLNPRPSHVCQTFETKSITVIGESGIEHHLDVVSCKCEPLSVTLSRLRLWPTSSKQPSYALTFDLLDWMEAMLLECQVSLNDFCKALNYKLPPYVIRKNIYPRIIDCFEEYRYFKHRLRTLQCVCPERDYGNVCPACPVDQGVLIESFDALFGLPRKKSAGSSVREPLHGESIFNRQSDVDDFIANYPRKQTTEKECSDFKAGDILRSATQYKALDETAVFGSACRHGFPKQFLNLKHGERIGYAVWLIKKIARENEGKNVEIKIMYDIACLLKKHLRACGQENLLENVTLAVPAFHIYGHRGFCQLQHSPRRVLGFGLSDGEQLERLWSYLRRFGKMTKEMRPSHRIDVLSDALLHYSQQCKDNLVPKLIKRRKRASDCIKASSESLLELSTNSPVALTEPVVQQLAEAERRRICGEQGGSTEDTNRSVAAELQMWTSTYVDKLKVYYSLRNNLCAEGSVENEQIPDVVKRISKLDKDLVAVEKANLVDVRWTPSDQQYKAALQIQVVAKCKQLVEKMKPLSQERQFLLKLKEKYSDGHALSKKLAKQVKNCTKKLKEMLTQYNSSRDSLSVENRRKFKELKVGDLSTELTGLFPAGQDVQIPYSVQRQAIDMLHLLKRSEEEIKLVEQEMTRVFSYYKNEECKLSERIEQLSSDNCSLYALGSISLLKSEQKILQNRLLSMHSSLKTYIPLENIKFSIPAPNNSTPVDCDDKSSESCAEETSADDSD